MGFEFGIKGEELKNITDRMDMVADNINVCYKQVMNAGDNLSAIGLGELQSHVKNLSEQIRNNVTVAKNLHDSLVRIIMVYGVAETKIALGNTLGNIFADSVGEYIGDAAGRAIRSSVLPEQTRFITNMGREVTAALTDVSEFEYTYMKGGRFEVPIRPEYLNSSVCLKMAQRIIDEQGENGLINGMDAERVAAEIFCHAIGYYLSAVAYGAVSVSECITEFNLNMSEGQLQALVYMMELIGLEKLDTFLGPEEGIMEHAQIAHVDDDGNPYLAYWTFFRACGM